MEIGTTASILTSGPTLVQTCTPRCKRIYTTIVEHENWRNFHKQPISSTMINSRTKKNKLLFKRKRDNYVKTNKIKEYLRTELLNSTTHGVPYMANNSLRRYERWFWSSSFIVSIALIVFLLSWQFSRYKKTPNVMSVEMDYFNWNVSYPAITLCPVDKVDKEALDVFVSKTMMNMGKNVTSVVLAIVSASLQTIHYLEIPSLEIIKLIQPDNYAQVAAGVFKKFVNSTLTTKTNRPISVEAIMTEVGMCHVINSNVASFDNPSKWSDTDVAYGRNSIQLSVHDGDFFSQIMNYAGVYKVYMHSPDEQILSTLPSYIYDVEGFLSLGVQVWSTKISESLMKSSIRLRNCRFIHEPISKRYPIYTYNHCMIECRIQMIKQLCGCVPHFYRVMRQERVCSLTELTCIGKHQKEIIALSANKETLQRFKGITKLPKSTKDCNCLNSCETEVYLKDKESFLPQTSMNRLRIGISTFPRVRVVRENIFSISDILLRSGGVINVCIGTSVISLMEFLIILLKIPISCISKHLKGMIRK